MIIAQQKRHENMAEYLLYLWQVEDIIRACKLDLNVIEQTVIARYDVDQAKRAEIRDWYESLVKMMQLEHVEQAGHLQICKNVLIRLNDLHRQLLASDKYPDYGADYYRTLPFIVELRAREHKDEPTGELETCFNALYGVLLLRLQGKDISHDTQVAIAQISHFLGLLSAYYKKDEDEEPLFD